MIDKTRWIAKALIVAGVFSLSLFVGILAAYAQEPYPQPAQTQPPYPGPVVTEAGPTATLTQCPPDTCGVLGVQTTPEVSGVGIDNFSARSGPELEFPILAVVFFLAICAVIYLRYRCGSTWND